MRSYPIIVSSAVKVGDRIFTALRHSDAMHLAWDELGKIKIEQDMQGFIASDGAFYNRFQAGVIAFLAGQTTTRKQTLLSEDIWPA